MVETKVTAESLKRRCAVLDRIWRTLPLILLSAEDAAAGLFPPVERATGTIEERR
jgi:hypothetical protein